MIDRRRLIFGGLGILGLTALGVFGFGRPALEAEIARIVRRRLSFLKLDAAGVEHFAKDQANALLTKRIPTWNRMRYHVLSAVAPSFARFYRCAGKSSRIEKMEDPIVASYLLSSDFFYHESDESRLIQYRVFYDPLLPCGNPFACPAVDTRVLS